MKKAIIVLSVGALLTMIGCSKSPNGTTGTSGYTCTCHYKVQFSGHDTTVATTYPTGTTQSQAASQCASTSQFYSVTYGDPTANCGL